MQERELSQHILQQMAFIYKQWFAALAPENFLLTNPQILQETLESQGKNLLLGFENFLHDFNAIQSTAFEVGKNLATTAGSVVFKNELIELIQYTPTTKKVYEIPLLIIPPWINKYYILDLSANNSLVSWLVNKGITVFMISWVNPDRNHADKTLEDYLNDGPLAAIEVIKHQLQVPTINALGFCTGGTLLGMLLAYAKPLRLTSINSATFLAAMLDFSDPGELAVFIDEKQLNILEQHMQLNGYLNGYIMAATFNLLRPRELIWSVFIKNYLRGQPPLALDFLYWNADPTNLPATMHSQYLRWMYLQNDLIKPGKIIINGTPLDLSKIDVPSFFVSTIKDHIAPWHTTYLGFDKISADKEFILGNAGHIAGIINPPQNKKYGYLINKNAEDTADKWLDNTQKKSGSWWPYWFNWLQPKLGQKISAPVLKNLYYQGIADAPGNYVQKRIKPHSLPSS